MTSILSPDTVGAVCADLRWDGPVPLTQVLAHVFPAYGGDTWEKALAYLHDTASEANVIAALTASGTSGFDSPISVYRHQPDPDDPEDVADFEPDPLGRQWGLGNGMHRIAAAVALGHETINCTSAYTSAGDDKQTEYVEVEFLLPGVWPEDHGTAEHVADALDWVCGWARSFPLPDGTWVESDGLGSHGLVMSGSWTCPASHADMLVTEMSRRYREHAPNRTGDLEVVKMRTLTGAQWDAEFEAEFGPAANETALAGM